MSGLLLAMLATQLAGGDGLDGVIRRALASPVVFSYPAITSGPLIKDTPNTVAHVTFNGSALVDSFGNTWTMNGTVPQVTGSQASPLFPSGFTSAPRSAAGPFSTSNYYSVAVGAPVNFATGTAFSVCALWNPTTINTAGIVQTAPSALTTGWSIYASGTAGSTCICADSAAACSCSANNAVAGGVNIFCGGWDGTNEVGKLNLGAGFTTNRAGSPYTQSVTSSTAAIGNLLLAGAVNGTIYEIWVSKDTPSDALFTAIEQRVFSEVAATGQAIADARPSTATYYAGGVRWVAPANVPRVEQFPDAGGALIVEPVTSTNYLLNSEAPATQTTASLGTGAYTGSMLGSGSIAFTVGTAVATGLPCTAHTYTGGDANNCHFTVTSAGTVTATIAATVTHEQLQNLAARTSDIITAGTTVTTSAEVVSITNPATLNGAPWCMGATVAPYGGTWSLLGGSAIGAGASHAGANSAEVDVNTSLADLGVVYDNSAALKQASYTLADSNPHKLLVCNNAGTLTQWVDGALVTSTGSGAGTGTLTANPSTIYLGGEAGGAAFGQAVYLSKILICNSSNGGACQ